MSPRRVGTTHSPPSPPRHRARRIPHPRQRRTLKEGPLPPAQQAGERPLARGSERPPRGRALGPLPPREAPLQRAPRQKARTRWMRLVLALQPVLAPVRAGLAAGLAAHRSRPPCSRRPHQCLVQRRVVVRTRAPRRWAARRGWRRLHGLARLTAPVAPRRLHQAGKEGNGADAKEEDPSAASTAGEGEEGDPKQAADAGEEGSSEGGPRAEASAAGEGAPAGEAPRRAPCPAAPACTLTPASARPRPRSPTGFACADSAGVVTGEGGEECLHQSRCRLFAFRGTEYVALGPGTVKLLKGETVGCAAASPRVSGQE